MRVLEVTRFRRVGSALGMENTVCKTSLHLQEEGAAQVQPNYPPKQRRLLLSAGTLKQR